MKRQEKINILSDGLLNTQEALNLVFIEVGKLVVLYREELSPDEELKGSLGSLDTLEAELEELKAMLRKFLHCQNRLGELKDRKKEQEEEQKKLKADEKKITARAGERAFQKKIFETDESRPSSYEDLTKIKERETEIENILLRFETPPPGEKKPSGIVKFFKKLFLNSERKKLSIQREKLYPRLGQAIFKNEELMRNFRESDPEAHDDSFRFLERKEEFKRTNESLEEEEKERKKELRHLSGKRPFKEARRSAEDRTEKKEEEKEELLIRIGKSFPREKKVRKDFAGETAPLFQQIRKLEQDKEQLETAVHFYQIQEEIEREEKRVDDFRNQADLSRQNIEEEKDKIRNLEKEIVEVQKNIEEQKRISAGMDIKMIESTVKKQL